MDWSSGKWVPGPNVFFVVCCNFLLTRLSCRTSIIVAGNLRRLNARVTSRWRHDDVRVKTVNPTQYSRRQVSVRNYFNSTSSMWNASLTFFHHNAFFTWRKFYPNSCEIVVTNFCTWHESCVVMACAKFRCDATVRKWYCWKWVCPESHALKILNLKFGKFASNVLNVNFTNEDYMKNSARASGSKSVACSGYLKCFQSFGMSDISVLV